VFLCVVMYSALLFDENLIALQEKKDSIVMIIFIIGIIISLIIGVFGLLYYFLYGRLLNPLKKNEKELMNINH
jgi:ABC-type antimicrobial peptide transport system permease subunit